MPFSLRYPTLFIIVFAMLVTTTTVYGKKGYAIKGFVGQTPTQAAPNTTVELLDGNTGKVVDGVTTNFFGKYKFSGLSSGVYIIQVGAFQKKVYVKQKDVRMDIDLSSPSGAMDYAGHFIKEQQKASASGNSNSSGAANDKPNNAELASQIAGTWWGYQGSTERKIGLCKNGSYRDSTESGYSGRSFDSGGNETIAWGSANQGGGAGTWTIQGNGQEGTIYVRYNNGNQMTLKYQQCGELGCLLFNGNKLCRSSGTCE